MLTTFHSYLIIRLSCRVLEHQQMPHKLVPSEAGWTPAPVAPCRRPCRVRDRAQTVPYSTLPASTVEPCLFTPPGCMNYFRKWWNRQEIGHPEEPLDISLCFSDQIRMSNFVLCFGSKLISQKIDASQIRADNAMAACVLIPANSQSRQNYVCLVVQECN